MKKKIIMIALVILSFAVSAYFYEQMPDKMASHWNAGGEVDGYMSKNSALLLMPSINLVMLAVFLIIPRIDPLKENIKKFRAYYDNFILIILAFMAYIHLFTILWNLGYTYSMNHVVIPGIAIIFYYSGMLMEHSEKNWFIGLRTPWTMSSDVVWKKSNKLAGRMYKALALVFLSLLLLPSETAIYGIIILSLTALYPAAYSYFEYKKIHSKKKRRDKT